MTSGSIKHLATSKGHGHAKDYDKHPTNGWGDGDGPGDGDGYGDGYGDGIGGGSNSNGYGAGYGSGRALLVSGSLDDVEGQVLRVLFPGFVERARL